jgi:PAS domain S-box-containing protein
MELINLNKMPPVDEKYRLIFERVRDAIYIYSSDGIITELNSAFEKFTGWEEKELIGKHFETFFHPEEFNLSKNMHSIDGENIPFKLRFLTRTGEYKTGECFVFPLYENDKCHRRICLVRDLSEHKELDEALSFIKENALSSARLKVEFLNNMAMETKTSLNGMIGFLSLLGGTNMTDEQTEYLNEVKKSSEVLLSLMNDIIDFSRIETGKLELEKKQFNLNQIVEETISLFLPHVREKNIEIHTLIYKNVPRMVCGDPVRLRQILINFVSNFVKFMNSGEMLVTCERIIDTSGFITLLFNISDTFSLSEEQKEKLFTAFSPSELSTPEKYAGTGLGINIAKKLIEMMGGNINVSTEAEKGITLSFIVRFGKSEKLQYENQTPYLEIKGLPLLLVDNSQTGKKVLKYYLNEYGCTVYEAETGAQVVDMLKAHSDVKIVLINSNIIEEIVNTIKNNLLIKEILLIVITSVNGKEKFKNRGFSGILQKPVRKYELLNCIALVTGGKEYPVASKNRHSFNEIQFVRNYNILMAEDNIVNQKLAVKILQKAGLSCDCVCNGRDALIAYKSKHYDLVLMDCQMPEMDGYEATRAIRDYDNQEKFTPVIAVTGDASKGDIEKCFTSGMDDYITKPFGFKEILRVISKWLPKDEW